VHQAQAERVLAPLAEQMHTTAAAAQAAEAQAVAARAMLQRRAQAVQAALRPDWDTDRPLAAEAARTLTAGPGRFGRRRAAVADAERLLEQWATKWRPVTPELTDPAAAAHFAARPPAGDQIQDAIQHYARQRAADQLPQHIQAIRAGEHAAQDAQDAADAYQQTSRALSQRETLRHAHSGYRDLAEDLPHLSEQTTTTRERLTAAQDRAARLSRDPAIAAHPDGETILAAARNTWQTAETHAPNPSRRRTRTTRLRPTRRPGRPATPARPHPTRPQPRPLTRPAPGPSRAALAVEDQHGRSRSASGQPAGSSRRRRVGEHGVLSSGCRSPSPIRCTRSIRTATTAREPGAAPSA